MKNFSRVLRLALRHRMTFVFSLVCALGVAVLWGGNIGMIYPFMEVTFENDSLSNWVGNQIDGSQKVVAEKEANLTRFEKELDTTKPNNRDKIESQISLAHQRIKAEQWWIWALDHVKPYVDRYMPDTPFKTIGVLIGVLLFGTVLKDLFLIGNNILVARLAQMATFNLRKTFYRRTLRMDLASFNNQGTSDLMSRFTYDMEAVNEGVTILFGKLVREPLKGIACLIGAGYICWRLLLLSLIVAPIAGLLVNWLAKSLKRANRRAMEGMAQLYNSLEETFRGVKVVKAFAMEPRERWRFHQHCKEFYRKSMRIARYDSLTRPITEVMGIAIISIAILVGAYLVLNEQTHLFGFRMTDRPLTLALVLAFFGFLSGAADPLRKLSDIFTKLQRAAAACDRIYAMLDREPGVQDPQSPQELGRHHKELAFDGVEFAYQHGDPVLKGIQLDVRAGETIALVGPNGCGKSTLANLIPRFADPTKGQIRIDGIPLEEVRLRELRGQIGLVSQETLLFDDTVLENIRYGRPSATREEVIEAARQAQAHLFIESDLADGYETTVGPGGCRLSGGQRQRIALARAVLNDPSILILDEATSQVDLKSEQLIQQVLEDFVRDRTTIIVTHRLAALALADRTVVMEAGRILDVGTHQELIGRCELYQRLYQIHFEDKQAAA